MSRFFRLIFSVLIVGILASCSSTKPPPSIDAPLPPLADVPDVVPIGPAIRRGNSRWIPVRWADLPGFNDDATHEAWSAWLQSCASPPADYKALCGDVRRLSLASADQQRQWMRTHLQPYRIEPVSGFSDGLLTSYFEPVYEATRHRQPGFEVPLYAPPAGLKKGQGWYSRRDIDTRADVQAQLAGSEIAWMADPVEVMILHIQGSGRVYLTEPDGSRRMVRLAFANTNNQPYSSPGAWLKTQTALADTTWPGIRAALDARPDLLQGFLWSNPRVVFFSEEAMTELDQQFGPRGAQGVALTPGRSIAVDPKNIPYGTPVWLASRGPSADLQRLVIAQDTGSAIKGAVRADYFAGWGPEAGDFAGRVAQPLKLWALWPK